MANERFFSNVTSPALVHELNELNFDSMVLETPGTVLVDFTAPWCPPCKALSPILARIADETWGRASIASVDVDGSPDLAARFRIRQLPTLVVFRNGKEMARRIGLTDDKGVRALLATALAKGSTAVA